MDNEYENGGYSECTEEKPNGEADCHDGATFVRTLSVMEQANGERETEEWRCAFCGVKWFV